MYECMFVCRYVFNDGADDDDGSDDDDDKDDSALPCFSQDDELTWQHLVERPLMGITRHTPSWRWSNWWRWWRCWCWERWYANICTWTGQSSLWAPWEACNDQQPSLPLRPSAFPLILPEQSPSSPSSSSKPHCLECPVIGMAKVGQNFLCSLKQIIHRWYYRSLLKVSRFYIRAVSNGYYPCKKKSFMSNQHTKIFMSSKYTYTNTIKSPLYRYFPYPEEVHPCQTGHIALCWTSPS